MAPPKVYKNFIDGEWVESASGNKSSLPAACAADDRLCFSHSHKGAFPKGSTIQRFSALTL